MIKYTEYNLHTHSFYCGHGSGNLREYVKAAEGLSLGLLGFSEHCPLPDGRFSKSRMNASMMSVYEADSRAQDGGPVKVLTGYECDWMPEYRSYYEDLLSSGRADYLITGTHFVPSPDGYFRSVFNPGLGSDDLVTYGKTVLCAMESGLFSFVAHPDLYMGSYRMWDDNAKALANDIIACSKALSLPLEINGNGMLKPPVDGHYPYPSDPFWELCREEGVLTVMNTDSHSVSSLSKSLGLLKEYEKKIPQNKVYPVWGADGLKFEEARNDSDKKC